MSQKQLYPLISNDFKENKENTLNLYKEARYYIKNVELQSAGRKPLKCLPQNVELSDNISYPKLESIDECSLDVSSSNRRRICSLNEDWKKNNNSINRKSSLDVLASNVTVRGKEGEDVVFIAPNKCGGRNPINLVNSAGIIVKNSLNPPIPNPLVSSKAVCKKRSLQKTSLLRKLQLRSNIDASYKVLGCLKPIPEIAIYIQDNFKHMFSIEKKDVVIKESYSRLYYAPRMNTVNWLLKMQQYLQISEIEYHMAVRVFDLVLASNAVSSTEFQLAGIVSMWSVGKFYWAEINLGVSKIYGLCKGKYSKYQIISMELKILKLLKFRINVTEPISFLHYYLLIMNKTENSILRFGAYFVLDCISFFIDSSFMAPSLLASAAVFIVIRILKEDPAIFFESLKSVYSKERIIQCANNLEGRVLRILRQEEYEPYSKYNIPCRFHVTQFFKKNYNL